MRDTCNWCGVKRATCEVKELRLVAFLAILHRTSHIAHRTNVNPDLSIALDAAHAGAATIAAILADGGGLDIRHKGLHDLVTRADTASETAIVAVIRAAFPDDQILGEEGVSGSNVHRPTSHVLRFLFG